MKNKIAKTGTKKLPEPGKGKRKLIFKYNKFRELKEEKEKKNNIEEERIRIFRMFLNNRFTLD